MFAEGVEVSCCQEALAALWQGKREDALAQLQTLAEELRQQGKETLLRREDGLEELLTYLRNNWEGLVPYGAMKDKGYLVASSLVEKAADLLVAKRQKKKQGMHWGQPGAEGICALRTCWLNED